MCILFNPAVLLLGIEPADVLAYVWNKVYTILSFAEL